MMTSDLPTIAIIGGTGKEGTGLAMRWAAAGYDIVIGSREEIKARQTAEMINLKLGMDTVTGLTNLAAVKKAHICILTVVQSAHQQALENLKEVLNGKILVDATSSVDYRDPRPPAPPCAGERAQSFLGSTVRVVAAFQNIPAHSLTKGIGQPMDAEALVCSDDIEAAEQVVRLANSAGIRGYYAGGLANAVVVEGLTAILISLNKHYKVKNAGIKITGIDAGNE
jgi:8-hydroxy-5-deazaflavin:NADPH oxidoreductase